MKSLVSIGIASLFLLSGLMSVVVSGTASSSFQIKLYPENEDYVAYVNEKVTFIIEIEQRGVANSAAVHSYRYYYKIYFGDNRYAMGYSDKTKIYVNHTYRSSGRYDVKVYVKDRQTGVYKWEYMENSMIIHPSKNQKPVAIIEVDKNNVKVGESVSFDASSSYDRDGIIVRYAWNFGDGNHAYGKIVHHSFESAGSYKVTLTVKDDDGASSSTYKWITVKEEDYNYEVLINLSSKEVRVGDKITVYAYVKEVSSLASDSGQNAQMMYLYKFVWGDGKTTSRYSYSKHMQANHVYGEAGVYNIKVEVRYRGKTVESNTETVNVKGEYQKDFHVSLYVSKKNLEVGEKVKFSAEMKEYLVSSLATHKYKYYYKFDFGDGRGIVGYTDDDTIEVFHTYTKPGKYYPKVTVVRKDGVRREAECVEITVSGGDQDNIPPVADISYRHSSVKRMIIFDASGSYDKDGKIVKYIWDFGDGSVRTTTRTKVTHLYTKDGTYNVKLTVVDNKGAGGTDTATVKVGGKENETLQVLIDVYPSQVEELDPIFVNITIITGESQNVGESSARVTMVSTFGVSTLAVKKEGRYTYTVKFGDGLNLLGSTDDTHIRTDHSYRKAGTYTIYARVTDNELGISGESEHKTVKVLPMSNLPPVALLDGEYQGSIGKPVIFDASQSYDPNGDRLYYRWDFDNDGIYDTRWLSSSKVAHTYYDVYDGYVKLQVKDEHGAIDECIARVVIKNAETAPITGEVDQSQEKSDGYVKIYQQYWYAQSFKPSKCGLDGIDLLIARKGIASYSESNNNARNSVVSKIVSLLSRFFGRHSSRGVASMLGGVRIRTGKSSSNARVTSLFIGDLIVEIYKDLKDVRNGKAICSKRISGSEISRAGSWIHINFNKKLKQDRTYYIVVHQDGGSDRQYYKWYYGSGDPYERGSSYDGNSLIWTWDENTDRDFCFRTYAHETGDEGDGVVERWAVILGCKETTAGTTYYADNDAYDWKECLIRHGWDESHIRMLISPTFDQVESAMEWLASIDDGDDLDLITWSSHGGGSPEGYGFAVFNSRDVSDKDLERWLNACSAKGFCLVADTCKSGYAIDYLKDEGRVILTSSARDRASFCSGYIKNSVFLYFLMEPSYDFFPKDGKPDGALTMKEMDKNNDSWVSAEEAFSYAAEKTDEYNEWRDTPMQYPKMYDGFDGDFTISRIE